MAAQFWFDGQWTDETPRLIGPSDHAMWQASVIFDGARAIAGLAPDLDLHCQRAIRSAHSMGLTPGLAWEEIHRLAVEGIRRFPKDAVLYVKPVFYAFRVMVGLGVLMLLLAFASLWAWKRRTLFESKWLLDGWRWLSPAGFVALLAGWYVVEIGRQPYTVYGVLRTADSVSPNIQAAAVLSSLIVYAAVYFFIFGFGIWYLRKLLLVGPVKQPPKHLDGGEKTPARPLSLPDEPVEGG